MLTSDTKEMVQLDADILNRQAECLRDELVQWRRALHAMPELKMDTPLTEEYISRQLRTAGAEYICTGVGGHGVTAVISGGKPGPCVALRADCDGLPVKEETGLPFASVNGNMHACGHDAHCAMLLGAAKLLLMHRDELHGSVKLIFQPYEEGDGGAKALIESGVLQGVDEIAALHTGNIMGTEYASGDVVCPLKYASANIWAFRAEFRGKGAHVCKPEESADPLAMAAETVLAVKRDVASQKEDGQNVIAAVTVIHAGVRNNIIPESCVIEGSVRAFSREVHRALRKQVTEIIRQCAEKYGGSAEIETTIDLAGTENDERMKEVFLRSANELLPPGRLYMLEEPIYMGEDFARYADIIPGFYFYLCSRPAGVCYPHHHPKFDIDETTLPEGAALLAGYALTRLEQPEGGTAYAGI